MESHFVPTSDDEGVFAGEGVFGGDGAFAGVWGGGAGVGRVVGRIAVIRCDAAGG
jgi:hypothetical protein